MEQESNIQVTVFEDNQSLRESLQQLLETSDGFSCAGAWPNCNNVLRDVARSSPDVVLMDIQMPGINGIEAVRMLREKYPHLKILMQTVFEEDEKIFQSICAGASGYILKNTPAPRFLDFIRDTYEGGASMSPSVATRVLKMVIPAQKPNAGAFDLSEREREVLSCLVRGMSYKMIADTCFISVDTVRSHIKNIYEKLHVHSKSEAVAAAIHNRIV